MKRFGTIALGCLAVGIMLLIYWGTIRKADQRSSSKSSLKTSPKLSTDTSPISTGSPSPVSRSVDRQDRAAAIVADVFNAPIAFFGKIQDQDGVAISGAKVQFGAVDKFWEPGSTYEDISDANGLFSIDGIKGAGLTVGVSKEGYDGIKGLSYQSFGYGMPPDSTRKAPPRRDAPALFILRKKEPAEPLFVARQDIVIPKDGTPIEVNLRTGKQVPLSQGDLRIECWTSDDRKDSRGNYDWRARVSVPGGGIVARTDPEREFEAPENGYKPDIDVIMSQSAVRWQRNHDGEYWVVLRNRNYARMRFRINTAGAHFATIQVFLNPSGSRNLEYDQNKILK